MKYVTIKVREDDERAVRRFLKDKREERAHNKICERVHNRFQDFWNSHVDYINARIKKGDESFRWTMLVNQELRMWAMIAEPVSREELLDMCRRRGFEPVHRKFLEQGLKYMGIRGW